MTVKTAGITVTDMATSSEFFEDNRQRISITEQPVEYNTNEGLIALSQEVAQLRLQLAQTNEMVVRILREFR